VDDLINNDYHHPCLPAHDLTAVFAQCPFTKLYLMQTQKYSS